METRANNALIGLFTLAVVAAAAAFVMWFARAADTNKVDQYRVVFSGSITGLTVGSNVLLNGIRVGQVDSLEVSPDDPTQVVGQISVKGGTPVKTDTRARMEFQGLTGSAYVQLYGGTSSTAALKPPEGQALATISAERSELQNLVDGARDTINQASQTLQRVDELLRANQGHIGDTVANIDAFTKALSDNAGNVSRFLGSVGKAADSIASVADSANGMTGRVQAILAAVDPQRINRAVDNVATASDQLAATVKALDAARVNQVIGNVEAFSQTLADSRGSIATFASQAADLSGKLNALAPKLDSGLDGINRVTAAIDPAKVSSTLASLDTVASGVAAHSDDIAGFIRDARKVSGDLAAVTPQFGQAVTDVSRVAAAIDAQAVSRAVGNLDRFSATLGDKSQQVGTTIESLNRVTSTVAANSDDIAAFIRDARKVSGDLAAVTPKFDQTIDAVNRITGAVDAEAVNRSVANLDRFAASLGQNSQRVTAFIDDASDIGRKVNASADRLDTVLQNVQTMTSSDQSRGMFGEITKAAQSVRKLADDLNSRTADLSKNLSAFSGQGLRDYQNLAVQGQAAVRDVQRTVNGLQRNPSQLIFGGRPSIPTYGGQ